MVQSRHLVRLFFAFMLFGLLTGWVGVVTYKKVIYEIQCGGHLKRAADANTVDFAKKELLLAINYLEDAEITKGYTSVFWKTPSDDVGFWYQNIKSSYDELSKVTNETTQLEKSNLLIKLRETILDHGRDGDIVTAPSGISYYPYNAAFFWTGFFSAMIAGSGFLMFLMTNYQNLNKE